MTETAGTETAGTETAGTETEVVVEEIVETAEPVEAAAPAPREDAIVIERPIQTVGRRKEAVVRVRLVPGTGKFDLDGRSLEAYFPNKVHQQLIKAPLVTVDRVGKLRHLRPPARWRPVRPGRRAAPGDRPGIDHGPARGPARAEEGRLPDP